MRNPDKATFAKFGRLAVATGVLGFGGGFAVLGRLQRTLVEERQWLPADEFLENAAVASALPGTTATNLLTMLGHRFYGVRGALVGAVGFVAPSALLMIVFGAVYDRLRSVQAVGSLFDGMGVAAAGVVGAVAFDLRKSALKSRLDWLFAASTFIVLSLHLVTLLETIALAGMAGILAFRKQSIPLTEHEHQPIDGSPRSMALSLPALVAGTSAGTLLTLLFVFGRIGLATFGGGFVMIPAIAHEVVNTRHWLGGHEFGDAIALGQITPGPVAIAATFIGYRVAGLAGALAATVGIFGPPFLVSLVAARSLAAFHTNPWIRAFLRGVSPAVVGLIASAGLSLFLTTVHSLLEASIALGALFVLLIAPRLTPVIPLFLGALVSYLASR